MGFSDLVSMLILGRGFVGSYVVNECIKKQITHLATTSNGREGTLKFLLPGEDDSIEQFEDAIRPLPNADSILITFPIKGKKVLDRLINSYEKTHEAFTRDIKVNWILLGTTSVFTKIPSDRTTPPDPTKLPERQEAENRLISHHKGTVVYLSGLYGGSRDPRGWVKRYTNFEAIMGRVKNRGLHIIHGEDVARAIIEGLYKYPTPGQRWIVSEPECYDMLQIFSHYMDQPSLEILKKIIEDPSNKQYIPESSLDEIKNGKYKNNIQRRVDPDEFWKTFGLTPLHSFRFDSKY